MIEVDGVCLSFRREEGEIRVLDDISFTLARRSSCAVIGPSGCGKTSLLFLLAGLLQPDAGEIRIEGRPRCGTILQNYGLFPWKSVADNIGLGLQLQGESRAVIAARVEELLRDMGLAGFGGHFPGELSGGMQQRVALARALAVEPQILLMDEPLSSLDALTRERLQHLILEIQHRKEITSLLVTHSIEEAVFLGRRLIVLSGRPARLLRIVDNPGVGDPGYRRSEEFFRRCIELRTILGEENDAAQA